jgi:hypothetical protein
MGLIVIDFLKNDYFFVFLLFFKLKFFKHLKYNLSEIEQIRPILFGHSVVKLIE